MAWANTSALFSSNKFKMHSDLPKGPFSTAATIGVTPLLFARLIWAPDFKSSLQISKWKIAYVKLNIL